MQVAFSLEYRSRSGRCALRVPGALQLYGVLQPWRSSSGFYVGQREEPLRRLDDSQFKIARCKSVLDQNVWLAKNVSTFF